LKGVVFPASARFVEDFFGSQSKDGNLELGAGKSLLSGGFLWRSNSDSLKKLRKPSGWMVEISGSFMWRFESFLRQYKNPFSYT
jgi:hypothetical protein